MTALPDIYPAGSIVLREVGLRDGLQLVKTFPSTAAKKDWIRREFDAGIRHFEIALTGAAHQATERLRHVAQLGERGRHVGFLGDSGLDGVAPHGEAHDYLLGTAVETYRRGLLGHADPLVAVGHHGAAAAGVRR